MSKSEDILKRRDKHTQILFNIVKRLDKYFKVLDKDETVEITDYIEPGEVDWVIYKIEKGDMLNNEH